MSNLFHIPFNHVNLIPSNNQILEIENVDDLITVCLGTIIIGDHPTER